MMGIQLIFCVEANKRSKTDWIYLNETLAYVYRINQNSEIKRSTVYMDSKSRYDDRKTSSEIHDLIKRFPGQSHVIMCVDTDNLEASPENDQLNKAIKDYCSQRDYKFVWFCRDIEEVYLGRRVSDKLKVKTAASFRNNGRIKEVDEKKLRKERFTKGCSNILSVMDNLLK